VSITLTGFRNHDLCARLYDSVASSLQETKRRCARVSRLIAKLRGHGLVAKVRTPDSIASPHAAIV